MIIKKRSIDMHTVLSDASKEEVMMTVRKELLQEIAEEMLKQGRVRFETAPDMMTHAMIVLAKAE